MLEETGFEGSSWSELCSFYPSPGFCNEIIYLFQVKDLRSAFSPTADPEEKIEVVSVTLAEAQSLIKEGNIKDGKTIIALQYAMLHQTY